MCGILCLIQYGAPINMIQAREALLMLKSRGPDKENYSVINLPNENVEIFIGFQRLSIMDVTDAGLQPFEKNGDYVVCNGEIYNHKQLIAKHQIATVSHSDCEIILPLYQNIGLTNMLISLDAEFALILFDQKEKKIYSARDRYGVRPLFFGYNRKTCLIGFASEMKALSSIMEFIEPVVPNFIYEIDLNQNLKKEF